MLIYTCIKNIASDYRNQINYFGLYKKGKWLLYIIIYQINCVNIEKIVSVNETIMTLPESKCYYSFLSYFAKAIFSISPRPL